MHKLLVNRLFKLAQEKVHRCTDRTAMTIAVDLGRKTTKQNKVIILDSNLCSSTLYVRYTLCYTEQK